MKNLLEEVNDVLIVAYVLGLVGGYSVRNWDKLERWAKRIKEARGKKEAANGHAKR